MSARHALDGGLSALSIASIFLAEAAGAQEPLPDLAGHFQQICGTTSEAGPSLPGNDIAAAEAPGFFADDLRRADASRVVTIGDRYAMRALVPSSADPQHAVLLKCAVASGSTSFSAQVERLSAMLTATPRLGKTSQGFDYAQFIAGATSFSVYSEPDGWVSIYKMDIMMRNVDPRYLRRGARPAPVPSVR
ncbi:MAG TPA: hypothetical protein VK614_15085 [Allosphingosinicella sp.]|nr:hypothetical protein [Allosphingosinicella sp.]